MKKLLSVLLVLAMAACLTVSAFAADSPTDADNLWNAAGVDGPITGFENFNIGIAPGAFADVLFAALQENPAFSAAEEMLDVLTVQEIDADQLPDTFAIKPEGVAGATLYAFASFDGGETWIPVGVSDENGVINVDVKDVKALAAAGAKIQIAVASGKTNSFIPSPQTGIAAVTYVAMSIVATACPAAAIVSLKKKEA